MNNDYSGSAKPLTYEDFKKYIERIFKPRAPAPPPTHAVDYKLLYEHGIRHNNAGDWIYFSLSELKRAEKVGAITRINESIRINQRPPTSAGE